jgi:hypothetical protein
LLFLTCLAISAISVVRSADNPPTVETPLGRITGYYKTSLKGRKYEVYEGIPYAQPPVGNLRFEVLKEKPRELNVNVLNVRTGVFLENDI